MPPTSSEIVLQVSHYAVSEVPAIARSRLEALRAGQADPEGALLGCALQWPTALMIGAVPFAQVSAWSIALTLGWERARAAAYPAVMPEEFSDPWNADRGPTSESWRARLAELHHRSQVLTDLGEMARWILETTPRPWLKDPNQGGWVSARGTTLDEGDELSRLRTSAQPSLRALGDSGLIEQVHLERCARAAHGERQPGLHELGLRNMSDAELDALMLHAPMPWLLSRWETLTLCQGQWKSFNGPERDQWHATPWPEILAKRWALRLRYLEDRLEAEQAGAGDRPLDPGFASLAPAALERAWTMLRARRAAADPGA